MSDDEDQGPRVSMLSQTKMTVRGAPSTSFSSAPVGSFGVATAATGSSSGASISSTFMSMTQPSQMPSGLSFGQQSHQPGSLQIPNNAPPSLSQAGDTPVVSCPKCNGPTQVKVSKSAKNPGRSFFSCVASCDGWIGWVDEVNSRKRKFNQISGDGDASLGPDAKRTKPDPKYPNITVNCNCGKPAEMFYASNQCKYFYKCATQPGGDMNDPQKCTFFLGEDQLKSDPRLASNGIEYHIPNLKLYMDPCVPDGRSGQYAFVVNLFAEIAKKHDWEMRFATLFETEHQHINGKLVRPLGVDAFEYDAKWVRVLPNDFHLQSDEDVWIQSHGTRFGDFGIVRGARARADLLAFNMPRKSQFVIFDRKTIWEYLETVHFVTIITRAYETLCIASPEIATTVLPLEGVLACIRTCDSKSIPSALKPYLYTMNPLEAHQKILFEYALQEEWVRVSLSDLLEYVQPWATWDYGEQDVALVHTALAVDDK